MILNSYAKLNLYLEVLNIRRDKYHNLKTVFERIDLADQITLKSRQDKKTKIICDSSQVPRDSSNLAYRSAKLLQDSFRINRGVDIKITKRIPVGAGLGGGSSNAAVVLMGLNKLWKLNLKTDKLVNFARKIGSDVPFFIYNCPFAQGSLRGDKVRPLDSFNNLKLWHILVVPKMKVSTPRIYRKWDALTCSGRQGYSGLTRPRCDVKILKLALRQKNISLIAQALFNNLQIITAKLYPEVERIKNRLLSLGLKAILMSGSGPAVFGVVSSRKEALSLVRRLKKEDSSWKVFVTRTKER